MCVANETKTESYWNTERVVKVLQLRRNKKEREKESCEKMGDEKQVEKRRMRKEKRENVGVCAEMIRREMNECVSGGGGGLCVCVSVEQR